MKAINFASVVCVCVALFYHACALQIDCTTVLVPKCVCVCELVMPPLACFLACFFIFTNIKRQKKNHALKN